MTHKCHHHHRQPGVTRQVHNVDFYVVFPMIHHPACLLNTSATSSQSNWVAFWCNVQCLSWLRVWFQQSMKHLFDKPINIITSLVRQFHLWSSDKLFRYGDFFSEKIIVGPQEAQDPRFWLPWTLTHYILGSICFRTPPPPLYGLKRKNVLFWALFRSPVEKTTFM